MLKKVVIAVASCLFAIHLLFTGIFLSPLNPVKAKYNSIINTYMEPLFSQNWKLFAPNPVSKNNNLFVRAEFQNGKKTDWIDLTSFMIEKNYSNRFSPYNRLVRIQRGAFDALFEKDEVALKVTEKIEDDELDKEDYKDILENEEQNKEAANMLNRYAQSYLSSLYPNKNIGKSQVLVQEVESVPFSKKDEEDFESESYVYKLDWEDYEEVSPIF